MLQALAAVGAVFIACGVWFRLELSEPARDDSPTAIWKQDPDRLDTEGRLGYSISALRSKSPDLVADRPLSVRQKQALLVALAAIVVFLVVFAKFTLIALLLVINVIYVAALLVRMYLVRLALRSGGLIQVSDEEARAWPDQRLPHYTVLVPAFRESEVFARLVPNLRSLEYPSDRLEILLLLEADDAATIAAAREAVGDQTDITIVLVPPAEPRTKPKALNFGLISSSGEIITIYDAEDRPDPLQLRKAAIALTAAGPDLACVQAKLDFFNPHQNLLTTWFTLEYNLWFNELLPGLSQLDAPIPLGGTSNHLRRSALVELGAWDPYNVTEDADLGIRLHRLGYRSGVLDSVTFEEANSDFINWVKQRSRWYKGYAQTVLVHLRHPRQLYRELGFRSFMIMLLFVGGTPALAMANPIFWSTTAIYFVARPVALTHVFPAFPYFLCMASWVIGNFLVFWSWMITARNSREKKVLAALLSPLYWLMMAVAALKAAMQLVTAPSFWEKTQHGLDPEGARTVDDTAASA